MVVYIFYTFSKGCGDGLCTSVFKKMMCRITKDTNAGHVLCTRRDATVLWKNGSTFTADMLPTSAYLLVAFDTAFREGGLTSTCFPEGGLSSAFIEI